MNQKPAQPVFAGDLVAPNDPRATQRNRLLGAQAAAPVLVSANSCIASADLDLGLPEVLGRRYYLSPDGYLTTGSGASPRYDENGALTIYRAAMALGQAAGAPLAIVPSAIKEKLCDHLAKTFVASTDAGPQLTLWKLRMRSGSATLLLGLIEACGGTDAALRARAVALYLAQANAEPSRGLKLSMFLNLERLEASLAAPEQAQLQALGEQVIPARPPYEKWFASGKRELCVRQYAHKDCWRYGDPIAAYGRLGFAVEAAYVDETPRRFVLTKTNHQAPGGPVSMRVEVVETTDNLFRNMDDERVHIVFYTGHSNLGGNVSAALRKAPDAVGDKLVLLAMCRGKQNIFEVMGKYPGAHVVTTDAPSYFPSVQSIASTLLDGCLNLRDYAEMRAKAPAISDEQGLDNYFFPHEVRRFAYYDVDQDGVLDGRGNSVDRLYNVRLASTPGMKVDGVARVNALDAPDLDGTPILHAVQFLNTYSGYHVEYGQHGSCFTQNDVESFRSGGWFEGPDHELVRLTRAQEAGRQVTRVQVNKSLVDQAWYVVGALVMFEVALKLHQERRAQLKADDTLRAAFFAGAYLQHMCTVKDEACAAMGVVARLAGMPTLPYEPIARAIDVLEDAHHFASDRQLAIVRQAIA